MIALKLQRLLRGWSQAELARRAHINSNTISQIESCRLHPYPVQLKKICSALAWPESDAQELLKEEHAAVDSLGTRRGSAAGFGG